MPNPRNILLIKNVKVFSLEMIRAKGPKKSEKKLSLLTAILSWIKIFALSKRPEKSSRKKNLSLFAEKMFLG